ncbi:MAG: glycine zipper domain-containing protein, partial [Pseudomonadota bacterium]
MSKKGKRQFLNALLPSLVLSACLTDAAQARPFHYRGFHKPRIVIPVTRIAPIRAPHRQVTYAVTSSQEFYVYPQRGQTAEEQSRDEYECYRWARDETGFDPVSGSKRATVVHTHNQPDGLPNSTISGAVGGAALGALGGAIAGDPAIGAAVGAGVGAIAGAIGESNQRNTTVAHVSGGGDSHNRARDRADPSANRRTDGRIAGYRAP